MILFNKPLLTHKEEGYLAKVLANMRFSGDGEFTKHCNSWLTKNTKTKKALLTTSCTHALEMSAILTGIASGDEVIMPSFTFVSTANAFVLRGAKVVFVDIRPDTMNIDENKIAEAITKRTKAIVPVHYGGVSCEMDAILKISRRQELSVIEDAAQGILAFYKKKALGAIGDIGCVSFHETKNFHSGEGGAIFINDKALFERAEIVREKGTNRSQFLRGEVDKYTWVDLGSSYLPSELNAAFLLAQLESAQAVKRKRLLLWQRYFDNLKPLAESGVISLPYVPAECLHNAQIFYIKLRDIVEREKMIKHLLKKGIHSAFHYVPLHSSKAGKKFGRFSGKDIYTTVESKRLLRLPLYFDLSVSEVDKVSQSVKEFFR